MDKWLLLHVMKTAGTSLRDMVEKSVPDFLYPTRKHLRVLPNGWYLPAEDLINLVKSGDPSINDRQIIFGHYTAALAEHLPSSKVGICLREPVARTISMISHRKRNKRFANTTVSELLDDEDFVLRQVKNYQTKILGTPDVLDANSASAVNSDTFDRAIEMLNGLDFLGLTERFDESIDMFSRDTGISFNSGTVHSNRGKTYELHETDLRKIESLVEFDIALYERATSLFRERLRQSLAGVERATHLVSHD